MLLIQLTLPLVRRSFARGRHWVLSVFKSFFVVLTLSPPKAPTLYSDPVGESIAVSDEQKWSETYITTLILPISVAFEAIWGCSVDVVFPTAGFKVSNLGS